MKLRTIGMAFSLLFVPAAVQAQVAGTGAIAGVVRDSSGAVLPGVTVEASSPALIEKVRAAVTDGQGVYRIVDLRPGIYTLTFTLPGFSQLQRQGVELTTGFTATVNAELRVGALEETVTVSGAAPLVDTQNVRQQQTLARETLDALPTSRRMGAYATLLPGAVGGAQDDVAGLRGEAGSQFAVHGQRTQDQNVNLDGMHVALMAIAGYSWNSHIVQEVVLETSGVGAEASAGGVRVNIVPKEGGNVFSGSLTYSFSRPSLQSANLTDEVRARGLFATPSLKQLYDVGGSVGGPIKRDRLWFFTAHRRWAASRFIPGLFHNRIQGTLFYEPDFDRPGFTNDYYPDHNLRLTGQVSAKDKLSLYFGTQNGCNCPIDNLANLTLAPEAAGDHHYEPNWRSTVSWSRPHTNRLLFEAAASGSTITFNAKRKPGVSVNDISVLELSTGLRYGSRANPALLCCTGFYGPNFDALQFNERLTLSYVTGSHSLKVGVDLRQYDVSHKTVDHLDAIHGARSYTFRNAVPVSVTVFATPYGQVRETRNVGAYVQDQWTIRRVTLNLGVRYDGFHASVPAQQLPPGFFAPARDLPAVEDAADFKNLAPRLGAAYDLFGNGRTSVKGSLGRYVTGTEGTALINTLDEPIWRQANNATRTWNDTNGNFVPDCVLGPEITGANGECGPLSDRTFGQVRGGSTRFAQDAISGFNDSQPYNWQGSVAIQHQLWQGTALNVGYFRTWYGNFRVTDNLAVAQADFDPYCITAPVDSRLPGGGGQQMCGLYDIRPAKFGEVDNLVTLASNYGSQTEVYNGVDVTVNSRFGQGVVIQGGLSVGRTVEDTCLVIDSPAAGRPGFCNVTPPWSSGTQVKFLAVYPLPWDLQTSTVYRNLPGIPIQASFVARNAEIAPSLGRNLGACRGAAVCNATATIDLIPPNTVFEDRLQMVDFRIARIFRLGNVRLEGDADIYNVFNTNTVQSINSRYGPQWLNIGAIAPGRVVRFGAQLTF